MKFADLPTYIPCPLRVFPVPFLKKILSKLTFITYNFVARLGGQKALLLLGLFCCKYLNSGARSR